MKKALSKLQKIVLLFTLGIGCPSLILGYLAFRGIQNDQALMEKERMIEHRQMGQQITESVADSIGQIEAFFLQIINNPLVQPTPALIDSIHRIKPLVPLIEVLFTLDQFQRIDFPAANLLYTEGETIEATSSIRRSSSVRENVRLGQQFEFEQEKFDEALIQYRQAFNGSASRSLKGDILNHIARVSSKAGRIQNAIRTYQTIIRDYSGTHSQSGLPLSLVAGLEVCSLHAMTGDTLKALQSVLDTYRGLIQGRWNLSRSQYLFFNPKIRKQIDQMLSSSPDKDRFLDQRQSFAKWKREDDARQKFTERLISFRNQFTTVLQVRILANTEDSLSTWKRFDAERGSQSYLVSFHTRPIKGRHWGILFREDYLKENLIQQILLNGIPSNQTGWIIRGMNGQTLLTSGLDDLGPMTVQTNFIDNFPRWILEIYQSNTSLFKTFLFSRRSIYLYIFLLIGGILIFGLILSIRSVAHELELSRMKSDFVSTISHEFKSPLTSIRQISEMLQSGRLPSKKRRLQYYDVLVDQSERLSQLIDNILDFSKLEEGKREFRFEPIHIETLLKEIITIFQHRTSYESFSIQANIQSNLPILEIDKSAMIQVIMNILDNAIKYSGKKKVVILNARLDGQFVYVAVKDFGMGVKADDIEKIFSRFYRGSDDLTRSVRGSGLGLALVKRIVEAHHGTVEVKSEIGEGSTFTIWLPVQSTDSQSHKSIKQV